jgi:DNA-binding NarL/FixJ family response regulator
MPDLAPQTIRVISVDDYPDMHDTIADLLASTPDIQLVGRAGDGGTALRLTAELKPDVLILDIRLPTADGLGGLGVAARVHAADPTTAILAWTGYHDIASYTRLRALGVRGYLHKLTDNAMLIAAVRLLASGGTAIEQDPITAAAEHGIAQPSDQEWAGRRR